MNVSVSVCNIVWGITKEGGIWCRQGITTIKPTGLSLSCYSVGLETIEKTHETS